MEQRILEMSAQAGPLYAPTPFWAAAIAQLLPDLAPDRLHEFRSQTAPLSFFVPTYGTPGNGFDDEQTSAIEALAHAATPKQAAALRDWISGRTSALADYRVLCAGTRKHAPHLLAFSESNVGAPIEQFVFDDRVYSRSALNYLMGLTYLAQFTDLTKIENVLEIGGGFGTLGEILMQTSDGRAMRYLNVDIPPTCFFADYYLRHAFDDITHHGVADFIDGKDRNIKDLAQLNVLPNWAIENLHGKIDLFVNFISFQEMEPQVVHNYLKHIDRLAPQWILLRNLREGKQLRSEAHPYGVDEPILSDFYGKQLPNYKLVGSDAAVFGFITSDGFNSELLVFERMTP
ncbi:putative sugar O-methyltransferase [Actibacterium sp. 188UL27-1]|uniref:putative sugar O-methyltransferase n=1 Tax=Actibacterium sp. 188UL27-1 TaxID=2786961 RepID=UPI00195E6FFA|nr:putative sugar O-methyltransferase [Actibacterium sp. 188UL27-1]MBM7066427.1 putative sugar O-methyltransferase [Actibacterium sp. 188UL27-1]